MRKKSIHNATNPLLNIYITAGYPKIDSLPTIIQALEDSGVDIIEIGLPYSDPLSDGPVIQNSNSIALQNGMTTHLLFEQLGSYKAQIPIILMGYFNSVFQYGVERFCQHCQLNAVKGVILPDLPSEEFQEKYKHLFDKYGISLIFLVTPQTSEDRIRTIDAYDSTFIYAVSSSSTTGKNKNIQEAEKYLARLKAMKLTTPLMVGFNIRTKEDFDFVSKYSSGGIIGSAFVRHLSNSQSITEDTKQFVQSIKQ